MRTIVIGLRSGLGRRVAVGLVSALLVLALILAGGVDAASAASSAPAWEVTDLATPSVLSAGIGHEGKYDVVVQNVGGSPSEGEFTVRVTIPTGLSVKVSLVSRLAMRPVAKNPGRSFAGMEKLSSRAVLRWCRSNSK